MLAVIWVGQARAKGLHDLSKAPLVVEADSGSCDGLCRMLQVANQPKSLLEGLPAFEEFPPRVPSLEPLREIPQVKI